MTAICGNGTTEAPEECDDGNQEEGDRCAPKCFVEHPDGCPGTAIHIAKGETITLSDTTAGATDEFIGSRTGIGNCGGQDYPGPDLVYVVMPEAGGMLTAELDAMYGQSFVRARPACPSSKGEEIACDYKSSSGKTSITFSVSANTSYYVAADSWSNQSGDFTLTLKLQ